MHGRDLVSLFCMLHLVLLSQSRRDWGASGQEGLEMCCRAQQLFLKLRHFAMGRVPWFLHAGECVLQNEHQSYSLRTFI